MILPTTVQMDDNSKRFKAPAEESQSGDMNVIHPPPTPATDVTPGRTSVVVGGLPLPKENVSG